MLGVFMSKPSKRSKQSSSKKSSKPIPAVLSLRLNHKERALLEELAEGMKLSTYVKMALFEGQLRPSSHNKLLFIDRQRSAKILAQLGQFTPPLRLLAKAALSGSIPLHKETLQPLEEACEAVFEIRDLLIASQKIKAQCGKDLH